MQCRPRGRDINIRSEDLRRHSRGSRVSDDFVKRNVSLASRLQPNALRVHVLYACIYIDMDVRTRL